MFELSILFPSLLNGLTTGAVYALIALGLVRYGGIVPPLSTMPSTAMAYVKQAGIGGQAGARGDFDDVTGAHTAQQRDGAG